RDVACDRGISRQRLDASFILRRGGFGLVEVDLGNIDSILNRQTVGFGDGGSKLSEYSNANPVSHHGRGAASHEPAFAMNIGPDVDSERIRHALDDGFDVEEIDVARAAAPMFRDRCARPCAGEGTTLAAGARKTRTDFEQSDVPLLAPTVMRDGVNQAWERRRPQDREILRERVRNRDELALFRKRRRGAGANEAKRHRLRKSRSRHDTPKMTCAPDTRIDGRRR